jgi:hypothetical protein
MTVKEAFSKAFGEVPEGASCHIGAGRNSQQWLWMSDSRHVYATYQIEHPADDDGWRAVSTCYGHSAGQWASVGWRAYGPDISDRPAKAFLGFFGEAYDQVVNATKSPSD